MTNKMLCAECLIKNNVEVKDATKLIWWNLMKCDECNDLAPVVLYNEVTKEVA